MQHTASGQCVTVDSSFCNLVLKPCGLTTKQNFSFKAVESLGFVASADTSCLPAGVPACWNLQYYFASAGGMLGIYDCECEPGSRYCENGAPHDYREWEHFQINAGNGSITTPQGLCVTAPEVS